MKPHTRSERTYRVLRGLSGAASHACLAIVGACLFAAWSARDAANPFASAPTGLLVTGLAVAALGGVSEFLARRQWRLFVGRQLQSTNREAGR